MLDTPVKLGDFAHVRTTGYRGRVHGLHLGCPESNEWRDMQEYLTSEQKAEYVWVSVLCDSGGSVCAPASTVEPIDPIPGFANTWASFYFGDGE